MLKFLAWILALGGLLFVDDARALDLQLTTIANNLDRPVFLTHANDGSGRLFIVEQSGTVRILRDGVVSPTPFLDVTSQVTSADTEQGLLGLAFAPDFATSGRLYVNYTDVAGDTAIVRFRVDQDPNRVALNTQEILFNIDQPFGNHNGGWLAFGPDGYLYIATGDGGGSNDQQGNSQNLGRLLGKILRLDVSGGTATVPPNNPFVNTAGARPEIWAYGLRNPWRASFDRATGDLWIGDVGQARSEEVNFQAAASTGGENYGWRIMEGSSCRVSGCAPIGILPISEYGRDLGCSVTGGYVYRGSAYPNMVGHYVFGDFCSGRIWSIARTGGGTSAASFTRSEEILSGGAISSFGEDEVGNLYALDYNGRVFLVTDGAPVVGPTIDGSFTGSWYDPAQSGHGFFVEVLPGGQFLAYWFTFSPTGEQSWFGGVGAINGNRVTMSPVRTTGGRFIPNFDANAIQNQPFGTMTFTFSSCRSGRVDFDFPEGYGTGSMALTRLTVPESLNCPLSPNIQ